MGAEDRFSFIDVIAYAKALTKGGGGSSGKEIKILEEDIENGVAYLATSASGDPASFPDGADDAPVVDLKVAINPVQSFNGYDRPWAGGGNINLFDCPDESQTVYPVTITPSGDGSLTISGSASSAPSNFNIPLPWSIPENTPVTFSLNNPAINNEVGIRLVNVSESKFGTLVRADSVNKIGTVRDDFVATHINIVAVTNHGSIAPITLKIQAELGETATSWTPYENICPITGWSGLTVYHSGADTTDPETLTVSWEDEAGEVYGGTLDVTTGVLTVDRAFGNPTLIASISFTEFSTLENDLVRFWFYWTEGQHSYISGADNTVVQCNILPSLSANQYDSAVVGIGVLRDYPNSYWVVVQKSLAGSTMEEAINWFKGSGIRIVFKVAAPTTYLLTPAQVRTLLGENNLWADTGDVTVEYRADLEKYIEKRSGEGDAGTLNLGASPSIVPEEASDGEYYPEDDDPEEPEESIEDMTE